MGYGYNHHAAQQQPANQLVAVQNSLHPLLTAPAEGRFDAEGNALPKFPSFEAFYLKTTSGSDQVALTLRSFLKSRVGYRVKF